VKLLHIVIISGLSGSGKTTVLRALEDKGFYCIDNMPATLIPTFAELLQHSTRGLSRVAVVVDIRGQEFLEDFQKIVDGLETRGHQVRIVFLESSTEALIRRYSETRRRHPLEKELGVPLREAVEKERGELAFLRESADKILDTTDLTVHQLRRELSRHLRAPLSSKMTVTFVSFGYSYGVPPESDIVMDVRFLANPFFVEELRPYTGQHPAVKQYVLENQHTREFMDKLSDLIAYLRPHYEEEGKSYLTIAVGCTGGKHRSVVVADRLAEIFHQQGVEVTVRHRDMERG
jgi:UPF0042 nucleotide-binding protein